ncbi:serine--tRNA synthetase-like protein Slimp [Sipha flava]|jgi:seryl-tRNA synthetase|uniref:Serine--tRNA synthetase-like protein Slimp n=2 Tax=Sipha flava TaxID=143950 RepID=A0A8B8G404_9HEMI|nr:serine--tRNA synthetase-like protein Slimp [Sipha flava]
MIKKLFSRVHSLLKVNNKYSTSKLYIPYNQTSDVCVVVEPFVNLENHLKNIKTLKDNVTLRGLNIDVDKICDGWSIFLNVRNELVSLNNEKQKLAEQLKKIKKENNYNELNKLKESRSKVMARLKLLREQISTIEKEIIIPSLGIPNSLHPHCPLSEYKILFQQDGRTKIDNENCLNHLEIGKALGCLDYVNSVIFYLKNEAALCEQAVITYFNQSLDEMDYIPLCNSDLIKSVIIEGCGVDINDANKIFTLSESNLYLVGGASLQSFCAFFTKQCVGGNKLPLKLYTCGRTYKPSVNNDGLFTAAQTNAVELFIGTMNESEAKQEFDKTLTVYKHLYENIGLEYRIVYSSVSTLDVWESLRAQVELYSVSRKDYIPVALLSLSGDYISKRLRIYWSSKDKQEFLHLVHGKIVDTNVLIGCLLEQNVKEFFIPSCLKNHILL